MANKKFEDFMYRDFMGEVISQDEFEEIMLEVFEEEEKYSLADYLNMIQMSTAELKNYIADIKKQYPELFCYGKERFNLCRKLAKAKREADLHLICLLLCDDGILTEVDDVSDGNLRSFAKYIFEVKTLEEELEERREIHKKWNHLLSELQVYDDILSVGYVAAVSHEEILGVYKELFSQNKIGPSLVQNLEALAVTASTPPLKEIAPLYIYQMLTKHISRLNKNDGLQVNQASLWKYQQYQIDFDNGKNFKANVRNIQLFMKLCDLFDGNSEVDLELCQYGFMQLNNLYQFCLENISADSVFRMEPLSNWILAHPFSCYPNGHEDAAMYRKSGISYLKYRRFRRNPAKKESLEHIFSAIVEREDEFVQRFLDADESTVFVLCQEILGEVPLNLTLNTLEQDLPIYLAVVNIHLQSFVDLAALNHLKVAIEDSWS